jgi:hypothetical protein
MIMLISTKSYIISIQYVIVDKGIKIYYSELLMLIIMVE